MKRRSIAIDGPSGAGKSTIAKMLAEEFGFRYVDTGAIYRTVGLYLIRQGVDPKDAKRAAALLEKIHLTIHYSGDGLQHMVLNGEDVTSAIREHAISGAASLVAAIPEVRAFLLEMQRAMAREHDVIMDGRDIGTQVLPDATLKIFLTATPEDRARRRFLQLQELGQGTEYETVLRDVKTRDAQDENREIAPLRKAEDAVLVDTTGQTLAESLQVLRALVKENLKL